MIPFQSWPKTTRLFRDITVTEKLDGSNHCITFELPDDPMPNDGKDYYKFAVQSRNRLITPENDNYFFASWVYTNHEELFGLLGYGRHYGEWWGHKIARRYDMDHRVFSIFNTDLWSANVGDKFSHMVGGSELTHTPVLYRGEMSTLEIMDAAGKLVRYGSVASPGFMKPEGVCVYHSQSEIVQKFTFDNQDKGKWESL